MADSCFCQLGCSAFKQALDKYTVEKDIAAYIKKDFDQRHNPTWHCVVGRNFGELAGINLTSLCVFDRCSSAAGRIVGLLPPRCCCALTVT